MGIGLQSSNFNKKWSRNITYSPCVNIEMDHTDQKSKSLKDNDFDNISILWVQSGM